MELEIWSTNDARGFFSWAFPEASESAVSELTRSAGRVYGCRRGRAVGFRDPGEPDVRAFLDDVLPPNGAWVVGREKVRALGSWERPLGFSGRCCCVVVGANEHLRAAIAAAEQERRRASLDALRARYGRRESGSASPAKSTLTRLLDDETALSDPEVLTAVLGWGDYVAVWARPDGWPVFLVASLAPEKLEHVLAMSARHGTPRIAPSFAQLPTD